MRKPLGLLLQETESHRLMCRCGECAETFWRLCIERGGVEPEKLPRLMELFELYRWSVASHIVQLFRSVHDFELDVREFGAVVSIKLELDVPEAPQPRAREPQVMVEELAELLQIDERLQLGERPLDRTKPAAQRGKTLCFICKQPHAPEDGCPS